MKLSARIATAMAAAALAAILAVGCDQTHKGSTSFSTGGGAGGTLTVNISDPATCAAPGGFFSHIFITVSDIQASTSATAPAGDPSFVDLTPSLKAAPMQVDLLGPGNAQCFLAQLATGASVVPGNYQQIRVILVANNSGAVVANNQCGAAFNCVVEAVNGLSQPLQLTAETTSGILIPSNEILGGGLNITAGQPANLDIDFNGCESVVLQTNGLFRLIPTLHAGAVSTSASAITGTVVSSTGGAIVNGTIIVALEGRDPSGVDRVLLQTVANSNGTFTLCPAPDGTHDVVVAGLTGTGTVFAATITTGVSPGTAMGNVPLVPTTGAVATVNGQVNTTGAAGPTSVDVVVTALQSATNGLFTVPLALQRSTTFPVSTIPGTPCLNNSNCATYTINIPAANPDVGAFSGGGTVYTQGTGTVSYTMDALAFVIGAGNTADCAPSEQKGVLANVVSGANTAPNLNFAACR